MLGETPGEAPGHGTAENHRPQPGRVFLGDGDGDGGLRRAPAELFPVDTLNTVGPRKVVFGDLNVDGVPDMFIAEESLDREPFPGEQNRLSSNHQRLEAESLPPLNVYGRLPRWRDTADFTDVPREP